MATLKAGVLSLGFLGMAGGAVAQDQSNDLQFPIRTAKGQTIADCTKLEQSGTIGVEFLRALDSGFHGGAGQLRPSFSRPVGELNMLQMHLQAEGLLPAHYQYIEAECERRLDGHR